MAQPAQVRLTVDLAIVTVRDARLRVLLVKRAADPFRGRLALPGGHLLDGETLTTAAARLRDAVGLTVAVPHLEQLDLVDTPDRDPRGRVVTVPYLAVAPDLPAPAGPGAPTWEPVDTALGRADRLAFDHAAILRTAVERARRLLEYTTLAAAFCGETFTIGELRRVYEVVWGVPLDPRNFNRKVLRTDGFVVPTGHKRSAETGRPAALYHRGTARTLYPPMLRSRVDTES